MIKNGLYSLAAVSLDGVDAEVGGVLILRDGHITGGDSFVFYTGTYECSDGKWMGEMISEEHTPTTRPLAERVQRIGFNGTYDDAGAEADATAVIGKLRIRYDASLRLLVKA
jgi:T3SS negative regulator,GrlR